ncbi:MAG: undecaprenyl-diphosphate phosphatase [Actinobacteria bacterium]|nr:undecaprenyl-diphosphate phosphatase [Actinomycetota bacterium]
MSILESIVLGIIQGLTEFFPISSSGHMVLVPYLFGWDYPPLYYAVFLHFATLMSLVTVFYRDIFRIIKALFAGVFLVSSRRNSRRNDTERNYERDSYFRLGLFLIVATIPSVVVGLLLEKQVERLFSRPFIVSIFLVFTACLLWVGEWRGKVWENRVYKPDGDKIQRYAIRVEDEGGEKGYRNEEIKFGFTSSIIVGLAQAIAIFPGISRSGATISSGRFFGISREDCVRFSFLLSIPIILGSFVFELISAREIIFNGFIFMDNIQNLAVSALGFISSYVTGLFAIKFLLRFTRTRSLNVFGLYCLLVGIAVFLVYLFRSF